MNVKHFLAVACSGIIFSLPTASFALEPEGISPRSVRKMARAINRKDVSKKDLGDVCSRTSPVSGFLLKNAYPGHINRNDPRASGFALVCASRCPRKFPVSVYYSDGSLAAKIGYYGRWNGNGQPRAYCAAGGAGRCSATQITTNSRRNGRDGKIYLTMGDGTCASAVPGRRNGGV